MGWWDRQTKNLLKSSGYRGEDTEIPSHGALHRLWGIPDKSPAQGLALLLIVEPFLDSRPRPMQKLNDRQAVVEFLVGTQGLEPWTQ